MMIRVLLCLAMITIVAANLELLLLHTNDIHSHFTGSNEDGQECDDKASKSCLGGMARLKYKADNLKKEAEESGKPSIFVNAGNTFQGSVLYSLFKSKIVAEMMNLLNFDAIALGDHEFGDGVQELASYLSAVKTTHICANINVEKQTSLNLPILTHSTIVERKGVKIGLIGILSPELKLFNQNSEVEFFPEIDAIRREVQHLKSQGVTILIVVGKTRYDVEEKIAKEIEDIDLIVGGYHSTYYDNASTDSKTGQKHRIIATGNNKYVPVIRVSPSNKYLGAFNATFDDNGELLNFEGQSILLSADIPEDASVKDALSAYAKEVEDFKNKVIGDTAVVLDDDSDRCASGECNIGNLIADSYVFYINTVFFDFMPSPTRYSSIALVPARVIRGSIAKLGQSLTNGDVSRILPGGKRLLVQTMKGKALLEALEFGVRNFKKDLENNDPEFLQVAGLKVEYNLSMPPGKRIIRARTLCVDCPVPKYTPIEKETLYKVITTESMERETDTSNQVEVIDAVDYFAFAEHITKRSPVYPTVERRIVINNVLEIDPKIKKEHDGAIRSILRARNWGARNTNKKLE